MPLHLLAVDGLGLGLLLVAAAGLSVLACALRRVAEAGGGYKAKVLASGVFVSGRRWQDLLAADVKLDDYFILRFFRASLDPARKRVTVRALGLFHPRTAVHRPGLGCALAAGCPPRLSGPAEVPAGDGKPGPWETLPTPPEVERLVTAAFGEPNPAKLRRTRAVLVVEDGKLLAEAYAPGITAEMPLCGWSMSKSVLALLVGAAQGRGFLKTSDSALLPEWSGPGDPRGTLTLEDLLRMRSGLAFDETYANPLSDVTQTLFALPDSGGAAAAKPLEKAPGTEWRYASGTSNIVSRVLRRALERAGEDYHRFPRAALFGPLGMGTALFETDAAGTFVGSSFVYAAARDWARLGQLLLQDGVWEGRRVLPEGWVKFLSTPTPQSPNGCYGAHWWTKVAREMGGESPAALAVPADAFHAFGHEAQCVSVIPSRKLVVVRLGLSVKVDAWNHAEFLEALLKLT
ncbi:serine hydrolase [bacterium]|nr:MAG: serine hydrolase [bacterium]